MQSSYRLDTDNIIPVKAAHCSKNVFIPHPIPYQGSKRSIAPTILQFVPEDTSLLIEPFAGSAAMSLATASQGRAQKFWINDLNEALMALWIEIIENPHDLSKAYEDLWQAQLGHERAYYDQIRDKFNKTGRPDYFLFLLARCVKGAVRYNSNGEFNQSPDNRRKGRKPQTMRRDIIGASQILKGKTKVTTKDYKEVIKDAQPQDCVYMDPPYQGVSSTRDRRYIDGVDFEEFVSDLEILNARGVSYILSYDGRTGARKYGKPLPKHLNLVHIEIDAGRSAQATLLGRTSNTIESLYLSPALADRLISDSNREVCHELCQQTMF